MINQEMVSNKMIDFESEKVFGNAGCCHLDSDWQNNKALKRSYLTVFALYLCAYNLNFTTFRDLSYLHLDLFYLAVRILCAVVLFARIVGISKTGFAHWQIVLFSICACLLIASTAISGSWNILLLFLFVVAGKGIESKDLAVVSFWCSFGVAIVTVTAASFGFISTVTMHSLINSVRQAPGFTHPNSLGVLLLSMTCSVAVLRFRKMTLIDLAFYGFMYYLCDVVVFSRTSAICILLISALSILTTLLRGRTFDSILIFFGLLAFLVLSCLTYYLMVFYTPAVRWMSDFNSLLSSRPALMHYFSAAFPPSLFGFNFDGVPIRFGSFDTFIVDNAYAHIVLESGILVAILLSVAWILTMAQALRFHDLRPSIFGLIVFSFVAFSETAAFFICINFCLIGFSESLYSARCTRNETTVDDGVFNG